MALASVMVCAESAPAGSLAGPLTDALCPAGQSAFLLPAYLIHPDQASAVEAAYSPVDLSTLAGFFGAGFSIVVFFFLLGVVGHAFLAPFWASHK